MSLRISATALNMHHECSDIVIVDTLWNAQIIIQAVGRGDRLGWKYLEYQSSSIMTMADPEKRNHVGALI